MDLNSILPPPAKEDNSTPWSNYQNAVFKTCANTDENIIVEAVAGSGKTTTEIEAINRYRASHQEGTVLAVAFNKSIATELQQRVPFGVDARTFHSLGLSQFPGRKPKVTSYKLRKHLKDIIPSKHYEDHVRDIIRMISLAKANALIDPDVSDFYDALDDYDVNCPIDMETEFADWAWDGFTTSVKDRQEIDFDDMLYFPVCYDFPTDPYDMIFVDEAQDLSPIQHEMVLRWMQGRVVAVGDTHQSIYGFRGADMNSMNRFRTQFKPTELPLSISYRCPRAVVTEAQRYVPHILPSPYAEDGIVQHSDFLSKDIVEYNSDDLILCRNNAPLFRLAMKFLKLKRPVTVRGNFGEQLISFVRSFKTDDIKIFKMRLEKWFDVESGRLMDADLHAKVAIIRDKYECCIAVADAATSVDEMVDIFTTLFSPGAGVVLSSIHRAKGTEAKHVTFYLPGLLPSRYAHSAAAIQQEHNLSYVGITRSLDTLTYAHEEL